MSQSKENIEAKLAEYVEDTLDDAGRAEIEQHLAANPEHRQLMGDLGGTRTILRKLPRQTAPAELTDTLQSQLERTVLLDDGFDGGGLPQIRRWPQVMAVAAILLLAVGLGLVVYVTLPPQHPSGFTIIEREVPGEVGVAAPQGPVTPDQTPGLAQREQARADQTTGAQAEGEQPESGGGDGTTFSVDQPPTARMAPEAAIDAAVESPGSQLPLAGWVFPWMPAGGGFGLAMPRDDVVVLMDGSDPAHSDERVVTLFRQQNITFERIGVASEVSMAKSTGPNVNDAMFSRPAADERQTDEADDGATITAVPADADSDPVRPDSGPIELPAAQNGYVVRGVTRQQAEQLLVSLSGEDRLRMNQVYNWFEDAPAVTNAIPAQRQAMSDALKEAGEEVADAPIDNRPMGSRRLEQSGEQYLESRAQVTPADDQPIRPGETIDIQIDELVGPGVTPQTQETVGTTGGIKLQMIPVPVHAEGRRIDELEKVIADQYRESNLIDNPTVRVRRAGATTQPAGDDQRVDLLIFVQNRDTAPQPPADPVDAQPPTPPTTQPQSLDD